ncbi:MAG: hypothetical protein LUD47_06010 [Clostridia bacterium]|nr:hypothetical protein [Clostridia bacterium]
MNKINEGSDSWRRAEGNLSRLSYGALKGSELKTCTRCLMTLRSEKSQLFAARRCGLATKEETEHAIALNKKAGQAIKVYAMMVGLMGSEGATDEWQHAQDMMSEAASVFGEIIGRYKIN